MRWFVNHRPKATIGRHSLNFAALSSSLREGAGIGLVPFNRVLANIRGYGRFSSPLRSSEDFGGLSFNVPLGNRKGAGDFHRPYEDSEYFTFHHSTCRSESGRGRAIFIAPTKAQKILHSTIQLTAQKLPVSTRERYRVGQGTYVWEPA